MFPGGIDPAVTVLRIRQGDNDIGTISWFATHGTSLTGRDRLISADNKGYASYRWEHDEHGVRHRDGHPGFLAAFAQNNAGDKTPNIGLGKFHPNGPTEDNRVNCALIGERQFHSSRAAFDTAAPMIGTGVDTVLCYIDLSVITVDGTHAASSPSSTRASRTPSSPTKGARPSTDAGGLHAGVRPARHRHSRTRRTRTRTRALGLDFRAATIATARHPTPHPDLGYHMQDRDHRARTLLRGGRDRRALRLRPEPVGSHTPVRPETRPVRSRPSARAPRSSGSRGRAGAGVTQPAHRRSPTPILDIVCDLPDQYWMCFQYWMSFDIVGTWTSLCRPATTLGHHGESITTRARPPKDLPMTARIVLFGATGYTGGLVLNALRRRDLTPVLAGRNETSLARIAAAAGGLEYRVADAADPAQLAMLVTSGDILISTVGPFERYGHPVARAAAEAGAHYIDSTGEVGFVLELRRRLEQRARDTGSVMLPAFGYDYVPGILAGTLAAQQAGPGLRRLDIGYFADGPMRKAISQGTRSTLRDGLTLPVQRWQNHTLVQARAAAAVKGFDFDAQRHNAVLAGGTEVVLLPAAFPMLEEVSVYNGWFPRLSHAISAVSALSAAASRTEPGRKLLELATRPMVGPPGGPDAIERARIRSRIVAVASSATAPLAQITLDGPNAYSLTGELIAWAAHRLLSDDVKTAGVLGPIEAFGLTEFVDACAELGLAPM